MGLQVTVIGPDEWAILTSANGASGGAWDGGRGGGAPCAVCPRGVADG